MTSDSDSSLSGQEPSGTGIEPQADDVNADLDLADLIEQHEATDWSAVPGVSAAEASAWTARLIEARETVQEGL